MPVPVHVILACLPGEVSVSDRAVRYLAGVDADWRTWATRPVSKMRNEAGRVDATTNARTIAMVQQRNWIW